MMKPISVEKSGDDFIITHKCEKCGKCEYWDYCLGGAYHTWNFEEKKQNSCPYHADGLELKYAHL